jgi:selenocysteine lyase/cysteine desulfurase
LRAALADRAAAAYRFGSPDADPSVAALPQDDNTLQRDVNFEELRRTEFPFLDESIYLNAASVGPLPARTRRAVDDFGMRRARIHTFSEADFSEPLARSREAAARLIGASPDEIALGGNTSFGINLAALSLPVEPGTCAVVSDREFPANIYPWMGRSDYRVELVPTDPLGRPDEDRIFDRLDCGDVSIFALSAVQFTNGYRADVRRFGEFCRERDIFFVVDAIQSLGQVPIDVDRDCIDVLATGGHKWLLSPFGTGFAYIRRDLIARMQPRMIGWTGMAACADLGSLLDYRWEFRDDARRFEPGTLPFQDFAGFAESVELLLDIGVTTIERHLMDLLEPVEAWLDQNEVEILSDTSTDHRSGILTFRAPDPAWQHELESAGVVCAVREGGIRFAPHIYNTAEEMARVIEILTGAASR